MGEDSLGLPGCQEAGPRAGPTAASLGHRGHSPPQVAVPEHRLLCPNSRPARAMSLEGPEMALTMAEADTQCYVHSAEGREGPAGLSLPQGRPCPQALCVWAGLSHGFEAAQRYGSC